MGHAFIGKQSEQGDVMQPDVKQSLSNSAACYVNEKETFYSNKIKIPYCLLCKLFLYKLQSIKANTLGKRQNDCASHVVIKN